MKMTEEVKAERREARKAEKKRLLRLEHIAAIKAQKPVKSMTINIEWKKSRMWGFNPSATARIKHHDGSYSNIGPFTCSGCGYDKESTVIAEAFNAALGYKLFKRFKGEAPYGVYYYGGKTNEKGWLPMFNGGVGTSCYYDISDFIGGTFKKIASGNSFDAFEYTDRRTKK